MGRTNYNPDTAIAERFLRRVDRDATNFTFQTFHEAAWGTTSPRVLHGTLKELAPELVRLNKDGGGVFVTVNETDGNGRKKENITRVRALFVDTDGAPIEPIAEFSISPSFIVASSPGRWHPYWLMKDMPLGQFTPMQKKLIKEFGTDPAIHDLPRVMRVPGFFHLKREPFLVDFYEDYADD